MQEKKKNPLKKMGRGDYGEKDTKLSPYTREKVNPRNWEEFVEKEEEEDDDSENN